MTDWQVMRLGEIIELKRGHDLTEADRTAGNVPVIGSAGQNGWHNRARAKGPGVTIGRSGASIGVVTLTKRDYWPHNTVLYVTDFKGNDPAFIANLLRGLNLASLNSGSAQPSLNRNFVYPVEVRLPCLSTQKRISYILSAYDDLIEVNQRRIAILEDMARRLFDEWFVRFRYPGHGAVPLVETELGMVPEGWLPTTLGEIARVKWGDTSKTKASYVRDGYDAYSAAGMDGALKDFDFDQTGVVVSAIGANCGQTWLAFGKWSCIKNTIVVTTLDPKVSEEFLFLATQAKSFWPRRGAAQPFISQGDARDCRMLRPSDELLSKFDDIAQPSLRLCHELRQSNRCLRDARDLLLPKLLSGEISVEQADVAFEEAAE